MDNNEYLRQNLMARSNSVLWLWTIQDSYWPKAKTYSRLGMSVPSEKIKKIFPRFFRVIETLVEVRENWKLGGNTRTSFSYSHLKIGYSRICACTKISVFCLPPGPPDENKGSHPSLIALQTELLLLYLNGVRRRELVAPNSNSSSLGAD